MCFMPEIPSRFPHGYVELRCKECGDVQFWQRRSILTGTYGPLEYQCPVCHGKDIARKPVTDWYVMYRDPFKRRRIVPLTLRETIMTGSLELMEDGLPGIKRPEDET